MVLEVYILVYILVYISAVYMNTNSNLIERYQLY